MSPTSLTLALLAVHAAGFAQVEPIKVDLTLAPRGLDMDVLRKNQMGYMPSGQSLVEVQPGFITKAPTFKGKPMFGALQVGNGPKSVTYFAVDEVVGETGKVYVDLNQNGDLTDDGSSAWDEAKAYDGVMSYQKALNVHASWGSAIAEEESGTYTIFLYKRHGDPRVGWTKFSAREGKLTIGAKTYNMLLAENGSDGIFTVAKRGDVTRRPVTLLIDLNNDGLYKGFSTEAKGQKTMVNESFSLERQFQVDGKWWDARPSISGAELTLVPSIAPGEKEPVQEALVEKPLLKAGTPAPDFLAETPDGKALKLSDFKGKLVILDFWATWCGPCKASMPGLQKIYDQVRGQGVVVLSLNVWDAKGPFDTWIKENSGKTYNFTFAFDPAGRGKTSIPSAKYNVSGIPTMYIIGRDGKVKNAIVGSGNEENIVKALKAEGISATVPKG